MVKRNNLTHLACSAAVLALLGCSNSHLAVDGGADAGAGTDGGTGRDSGMGTDAGGTDGGVVARGCEADDATSAICPDLLCDGPSSWHWNGDDCFEIDCGACVGDDCGVRTFSRDACLAAHASCVPALCRSTGGEWRWWAEQCGHHECGFEPPAICESPGPGCDCGLRQRFDPALGCVTDTTCPIPEPVTTEELCEGTGGTWDTICCDTVCGVPCDAECLAPACDCGDGMFFEREGRGCVDVARCHEPLVGESCAGEARCANPWAICCEHCGGAGCSDTPTCEVPLCDDDPDIDVCGNNLLAP